MCNGWERLELHWLWGHAAVEASSWDIEGIVAVVGLDKCMEWPVGVLLVVRSHPQSCWHF